MNFHLGSIARLEGLLMAVDKVEDHLTKIKIGSNMHVIGIQLVGVGVELTLNPHLASIRGNLSRGCIKGVLKVS